MLAQTLWFGFAIGELSCPARYSPDSSSINFKRSVKYGFGVLGTAFEFRLAKLVFAPDAPFACGPGPAFMIH